MVDRIVEMRGALVPRLLEGGKDKLDARDLKSEEGELRSRN